MKKWKVKDLFCFDSFGYLIYEGHSEPIMTCTGCNMADSGTNKINYKELYEKIFTEDSIEKVNRTLGFDCSPDDTDIDPWCPKDNDTYIIFKANVEISPKSSGYKWAQKIEYVGFDKRFLTELSDV